MEIKPNFAFENAKFTYRQIKLIIYRYYFEVITKTLSYME